ncbi:DUF397 domain-containing protein [Streptomyces lichenis]|uniref:DUF397 domain-containing protein n=1 Tax=Streptomyces lichenis TaxID=2306967 RepID=A0ABT0I933_9ACTN|nr:DUF397 domain-containing protein [Streptomyces lichenis]MCK8677841.1 DUF397 domain-containing protein [Streptomyces lichenis]
MNDMDLSSVEWRKSSYSGGTGQCVEVARLADAVALRDSKDPQGPALAFAPAGFSAFVRGVAGGGFEER